VLTRRELEDAERAYWIEATSLGLIFTMGVAVALAVQLIIPYQILSTDIANRLPEYATLKAIGYSQRSLWGTVWQQAVILALASFVIGLAVSLALYEVTERATRLPMTMPMTRVGFVFASSLGLASIAAGLSIRRTRSVDPAELF
jgi:putative ABC transport system permease protein